MAFLFFQLQNEIHKHLKAERVIDLFRGCPFGFYVVIMFKKSPFLLDFAVPVFAAGYM